MQGLGILLTISSVFWGTYFAIEMGRILNRFLFGGAKSFQDILDSAFGIFGFLFIPPLVAMQSNKFIGADIETGTLREHFYWASTIAVITFCFSIIGLVTKFFRNENTNNE